MQIKGPQQRLRHQGLMGVCVCEGGKSHIENDLKHARTLITNFPKAPVKWGKY